MGLETVSMVVLHARLKLGARKSNMRALRRLIGEVLENLDKQVDLVVLPPYPFTGPVIGYYPENRLKTIVSSSAEILSKRASRGHGAAEFLRRLAVDLGVGIIVGPMIERAGPRLYVTVSFFDKMGGLVSKYRKIGVTSKELASGINPGREIVVFKIPRGGAKVGVFVDEDLAYPEVFRSMQANGANIALGFMLPYISDYFKLVVDENNMLTMDRPSIESFLSVRSRETGIPIVLVGGVVESNNKPHMAYMPTIPVDPDAGIVRDKVRGVGSMNSYLTVEVDVKNSRPSPLNPSMLQLCKKLYNSR